MPDPSGGQKNRLGGRLAVPEPSRAPGLTRLTPWLGLIAVPPALYGLAYAMPWLAGAALTAGAAGVAVARGRGGRSFWRLVAAAVVAAAGLWLLVDHARVQGFLLFQWYGSAFRPAAQFQDRARAAWKIDGGEAEWPVSLILDDAVVRFERGKEPERLREILRPAAGHGRVLLLFGSAGAGKSALVRVWTHLAAKHALSDCVFRVPLRRNEEAVRADGGLADVVAREYREVVADPAYYRALFARHRCILFLDDLDEIGEASVDRVLAASLDLARSTPTLAILASRPEAVVRSRPYRAGELRPGPTVSHVRIGPIADVETFLGSSVRYLGLKRPDIVARVRERLAGSGVLRDAASELDHLQGLAVVLDDPASDRLGDWDLMERLVQRRLARNLKTHWKRLGWDPGARLEMIEAEALRMSAQGDTSSTNATLRYSGFTEIDPRDGRYHFRPAVFRSYLAARRVLRLCQGSDRTVLERNVTEKTLPDLRRFAEILPGLRRCLCVAPGLPCP
jgi:hypothetical protein